MGSSGSRIVSISEHEVGAVHCVTLPLPADLGEAIRAPRRPDAGAGAGLLLEIERSG